MHQKFCFNQIELGTYKDVVKCSLVLARRIFCQLLKTFFYFNKFKLFFAFDVSK